MNVIGLDITDQLSQYTDYDHSCSKQALLPYHEKTLRDFDVYTHNHLKCCPFCLEAYKSKTKDGLQ